MVFSSVVENYSTSLNVAHNVDQRIWFSVYNILRIISALTWLKESWYTLLSVERAVIPHNSQLAWVLKRIGTFL